MAGVEHVVASGRLHRGDASRVANKYVLLPEIGPIAVVHGPEDDREVFTLLAEAGVTVASVAVTRTLIDELLAIVPDLVVVDHSSGFDLVRVCRDVRATLDARILVVSAAAIADERLHIATLDAGADDVLHPSTSAAMLRARLRVAIRSRPAPKTAPDRLVLGDVVIDLAAHDIYIAGRPVRCPPRKFLLFVALARSPNRAVDQATLLSTVWGADPTVVDPRRVRIAISGIRSILGSGPQRPRIETVPQFGYRLAL